MYDCPGEPEVPHPSPFANTHVLTASEKYVGMEIDDKVVLKEVS